MKLSKELKENILYIVIAIVFMLVIFFIAFHQPAGINSAEPTNSFTVFSNESILNYYRRTNANLFEQSMDIFRRYFDEKNN